MMRSKMLYMRLLPVTALMALLAACASMGRPEGGERDTYPPVFVRSNPMQGTLDFHGNKLTLYFDENVQLDNPSEKVVVSPAQKSNPSVSANGRRVTVEFRDTLLPNTTYTIDFADAIKDLNEGNVLDGFAVDFSTGDVLDSLRISGMVFNASNLEPAQGMLVGAYLDRGDTAILTTRFDRITKTNQLGQFTLRNLKHGNYRVYALTDNNRDFHWDRSEGVAFYDTLITPWSEPATVMDTLYNADGGVDSIVPVQVTRFYPNDILLTWFNENYLAQYLKEYSRPERNKLMLMLGAPTDTLPSLRLLNGPRAGQDIEDYTVLEANGRLDSLVYWITDTMVVAQDSMLLEATYQRVDSLDNLVWTTDTLKLHMRRDKKKEKEEKESAKKAEKEKKKKHKDGDDEDGDTIAVPEIAYMQLGMSTGNTVDLDQRIGMKSQAPIASLDTAGVRMEMLVDSVWTTIESPRFMFPSDVNTLEMDADYKWMPTTKYRLTVDSAAVYDIYGLFNRRIVHEFTTRGEGDYSALFVNVSGERGTNLYVQLLNASDVPVRTERVVNGTASFLYVTPGTYYMRLFIDTDGDGKWTTGHLREGDQPEEVYYYPGTLNLRKNWDVEQSWDIYATPIDRQKPDKIKKNKPKRRPGDPLPPEQRENDDDEFDNFDNFQTNPYNTNNGSTYNPNNIGVRR